MTTVSDSSVFKKQVQDFDGRPFYLAIALIPEYEDGQPAAADVVAAVAARELDGTYETLVRKANAAGCLLREVPQLWSDDAGPFHPAFDVTGTRGRVTSIRWVPERATPGRWNPP